MFVIRNFLGRGRDDAGPKDADRKEPDHDDGSHKHRYGGRGGRSGRGGRGGGRGGGPLGWLRGPRDDGFTIASSETALFTPTTPEVDGDECLRDCEGCVSKLPAKFLIDESKNLYGQLKPFQRHLLVATGKSDWVRCLTSSKIAIDLLDPKSPQ
jgi:hypothetical protein